MTTRRKLAARRRRAKGEWERSHDNDVDEVRVARYQLLIQSGYYHRSGRELAERILERDLEHLPPWAKRFGQA